ncbi:MAG: methyltransferase domain-containing protein [Hydrogenophaga sp.]|uniref:methyltransferase domain-containing protein n=1 Tax=Hydrogenophaga sp. TaxID=1904254 RepID=UPI00260B555D|nr:methyltransferase domain-containing protein [Hydrogenophaga sp.]MDM7943738.1 methyltransferase domain-containing protein [Hydrogenophaga sp.]
MSIRTLRQAVKRHLPQPIKSLLVAIKYRGAQLPEAEVYCARLKGKLGLEIGGPSTLFATQLPVYQLVRQLDGVNFSASTIWEGDLEAGNTFRFHGWKKGRQFVADATDLSQIGSESYDFLLSSNCLEHVANPLKAMSEWVRVVKRNGHLLLALPNKAANFDHRRPVTSFQHLLEDFHKDVGEDDLTHLDEILRLHDLSMDPPAGTRESFQRRSLDNVHNRTLHHHVFDRELIGKIFEHAGLDVIAQQETPTDHIAFGVKRS